MRAKMLVLHIDASPEEALERIRSSVDRERRAFNLSGFAGRRAFIGRFDGTHFRLRKRHYYGNPLARSLYGTVFPNDGESEIRVEFRVKTAWKLYFILWFGLWFSLTLIYLIISRDVASVFWFLMPGVIGFLVLQISRYLCLHDERAMLSFLEELSGSGYSSGRNGQSAIE